VIKQDVERPLACKIQSKCVLFLVKGERKEYILIFGFVCIKIHWKDIEEINWNGFL
jgi:hypothetical protein